MKKMIKRRIGQTNVDLQFSEGLHPLLKRIFAHRGLTDREALERSLKALLPYHSLKGIDEAVTCLIDALKQDKKIIIVGDYDADGATSCVVAMKALRWFGAQHVSYIVPNRFEYGYGLTPKIVDVAAEQYPDLLITVDNGIASLDGVKRANDLGIDVLITDHHLPPDKLPRAKAIVNPNQAGDTFASKHLAGVGVIFYVMLALRQGLKNINWFNEQGIAEPQMAQLLDVVALGTVADVVALDKNNRILVYQGMRRIRAGKCNSGILALLQVAQRDYRSIRASDLGFAVGPRLNAAGRMDDMSIGIECLLTDDPQKAYQLASQLDTFNRQRRTLEAEMQEQAHAALSHVIGKQSDLPFGISLFEETWHQGIIGIVASRIKEKYHRPVIAFAAVSEDEIKGSGRSIAGVHIRDLLDAIATQNPGLISKFGGHAMAAGLSIAKKDFPTFARVFNESVEKIVDSELLQDYIITDGDLAASELTLSAAELLSQAGPWGQAFPEPCFDGHFIILEQRLVGEKHLKLSLEMPGSNRVYDAIAFNIDLSIWPNERMTSIHAAYRLDVNEFQGRRRLQLIIEYLEPLITV